MRFPSRNSPVAYNLLQNIIGNIITTNNNFIMHIKVQKQSKKYLCKLTFCIYKLPRIKRKYIIHIIWKHKFAIITYLRNLQKYMVDNNLLCKFYYIPCLCRKNYYKRRRSFTNTNRIIKRYERMCNGIWDWNRYRWKSLRFNSWIEFVEEIVIAQGNATCLFIYFR